MRNHQALANAARNGMVIVFNHVESFSKSSLSNDIEGQALEQNPEIYVTIAVLVSCSLDIFVDLLNKGL